MPAIRRTLTGVLPAILLLLSAAPASADPVTFRTRISFEAAVGATLVDDFSDPGYRTGDVMNGGDLDQHTDARMSAVFGETRYRSTGRPDGNLVWNQDENPKYCAGCNGSFLLTFTSTSLGSPEGIPGVGFDYINSAMGTLYGATVTLADGRIFSYQLPLSSTGFARDTPRFWGITTPDLIRSIHFGARRGLDATESGSFAIDNLTLGAPALEPVPEPATLLLLATGLAGLTARRLRA